MSLSEKISQDMKDAMKAKQDATLSTLRLLRSAIKNKQIDLMHELSDSEIQDVIKSQVKQLKDAIATYEQGERLDMAQSAKVECSLLQTYLPEELLDEVLEALLRETLSNASITQKVDMGKAMGLCVKAVSGKADGSRIKEIVSKILVSVVFFIGVFGISQNVLASGYEPVELVEKSVFFWKNEEQLLFILKMFRILLLWAGVFSVNTILRGGFQYATEGSRDKNHHIAMAKVTHGIFGAVITILLFVVSTMMITKYS